MSDIPEIMEIEKSSFDVPWPDFLFTAHITNPGFLVYEDEKILGYVIIGSTEDKRKAHLQSIAVHRDYRRRGIASKLLEWSADLVKLYGFNIIVLEVREKNEAARLFYSMNGFETEGRIENYYLDDNAIIMSRNI